MTIFVPIIIDDIALRALGIDLGPLDMLWYFERIQEAAEKELYNPEKISDELKNNRMLYELGEISKEEYENHNERLNHKLKKAKRINKMHLSTRLDILEGRK